MPRRPLRPWRAWRRWLQRHPPTLGWWLLGPALLVLLAALAAVSWTAYRSAQLAIQRFERQVAAEIGNGLETQLQALGAEVSQTLNATRDALRRGLLRTDAAEVMQQYCANQLRHRANLNYLVISGTDGSMLGAIRRVDDGGLRALQVGPAPAGRLTLHHLSALDDLPAGLDQQGPAFDARERPSYQRARSSLRAGWNPVSAFQSVGSLGMGMSAPLLAADGSCLQGVVSVGLTLTQLSRALSGRFAAGNGLAFIAEPDGQLLATSVPESLARIDNNGALAKRRFADMTDERLRALAPWFSREQPASQRLVTIAGVRYALDQRRLQLPGGLELVLGVLIEERELQGSMWGLARTAALWVLAISVVGGLLLLWTLRHVQQRVQAVSEAAQRLADGDRRARAPENIPMLELRSLAQSFNRMSCQVEAVVSGLEGEVASRTQALEAANAELQRLVALDGLTQIANRRHFDTQLLLAWRRGLRHRQPVALLLVDVDDFKAYNDHYGHPAGDEVLRQVAALLQAQQRRPDDLAARYGGEEFVLLLPDAQGGAALQAAQQLLASLRERALPHARSRVGDRVSASIGVAALVPEAGIEAQALVDAADAALYAAKQAGRDRAVLAPTVSHDEKS